jgi:hypothetical protein
MIFIESSKDMPEEENYFLRIFLPYLESFHYSGFNVATFVENHAFGAIRSLKEDDVKFWTLFEKMHRGCNANFYKNQLTSIVSSPIYPFFFI